MAAFSPLATEKLYTQIHATTSWIFVPTCNNSLITLSAQLLPDHKKSPPFLSKAQNYQHQFGWKIPAKRWPWLLK